MAFFSWMLVRREVVDSAHNPVESVGVLAFLVPPQESVVEHERLGFAVDVHGLFEAVDAVHLGDDLVWGGLAPVGDVGDLDVPVAGRVVIEHDPHLVDKVGQDVGVGHLQRRPLAGRSEGEASLDLVETRRLHHVLQGLKVTTAEEAGHGGHGLPGAGLEVGQVEPGVKVGLDDAVGEKGVTH